MEATNLGGQAPLITGRHTVMLAVVGSTSSNGWAVVGFHTCKATRIHMHLHKKSGPHVATGHLPCRWVEPIDLAESTVTIGLSRSVCPPRTVPTAHCTHHLPPLFPREGGPNRNRERWDISVDLNGHGGPARRHQR